MNEHLNNNDDDDDEQKATQIVLDFSMAFTLDIVRIEFPPFVLFYSLRHFCIPSVSILEMISVVSCSISKLGIEHLTYILELSQRRFSIPLGASEISL